MKNALLSPELYWNLPSSEQFFFLSIFLYRHCLITIQDDAQVHCLLPIKKFLLHQFFKLGYFKAQEIQVEILVVF